MITPIKNVFFNVNNICQYRCSYCWVRKTKGEQLLEQSQVMSLETLQSAYDIFKKYQENVLMRYRTNELNLIFATKEPLLEYERLIHPFILGLNNENLEQQIKFSILTNGLLLTPEIGQFCSEHKVKILMSLDGNMESNNTNRLYYENGNKSVNLAFQKTIAGAAVLTPDQRHFTFTINKNTISYLYDSLVFLSEYPHEWTRFNFNLYSSLTSEEWAEIHKIFNDFISAQPAERLQFLGLYSQYSPAIDENRGIIMGVSHDGIIGIKKPFHSSIPWEPINREFYQINDISMNCGSVDNPMMENLSRWAEIHGISYSSTCFENMEKGCQSCFCYSACHPQNIYSTKRIHTYYLLEDECKIRQTNFFISQCMRRRINELREL